MATRTITTKLALDGEAEYRAKIKNINSELALHKSELAKVQAQYKDSANSMTALESKQSALKAQLSALNEKHKEQSDMLEKAQAAYQKYAQQVEELEARQKELQSSTADTTEEEKALAEELDKAKENMQAAANSTTFYQKQLNTTEKDQADLNNQLKQTEGYLDEAKSSTDGCATSIDQYGKRVKEAARETGEFSEKAQIGVEQLAAALAAAGIAKGAKEIAEALWDCSVAAEGFEKTVAKISTIADTSSVSLDDIRAKVLELSGDSGKAASSISEAVYQAISSGAETSKAAGTVEKANKLAVGGFTAVETAVDVLTTSLNAYKLQASETEKISDILITTQKKGKTTVDELAQSVGKVIPLAAAYNVQMDNLGTAYAVLTANGIATAEATTYTKSMLRELGDSGSQVAKILKEKTGKSFAELSKEGRSIGDVLAVLGDSVGGSSTAFNELWSSAEAGVGALSLFNSGADRFNSVLEEMQNSAGATEAAYQKMANTTEFAHQRMANASDNLRIVIGEQLNPALKDLYNSGADAFIWATDFVEQNPWIVGAISAVTVGVGTLTVGLTLAANATNIAAAAQAALNAVMSANPYFLATAGLTALVAAVAAYSLATGSAGNETKKLTKSLKESKAAYEELTAEMEAENANISSSVKALKALMEAENKSAAQKEALIRMVDQLNEAIPELGLAYDAATDSINMTGDALERMTQDMADQDEHSAQVERLSELYTEQQAITDQLAETQEKLDTAMANAQWDSFGGAMNEAATQVSVLQGNVESLTAAQEDATAQITALEEAVGAYSQQQTEAVVPTQEMEDRIAALSGQLTELESAYLESYDAAMESIDGQMKLFQEMDGTAKTSVDNLIETLKGQVAYMETYAENINKAMEMGVDMGLVKKLSDGSEESAQILAAIVQGGEEDIKALNEQLAKVEEGKENFSNTVAEMETDFKAKMDEVQKDLENAIKDMDLKDDAYKAGWNNVQGLIDGTAAQKQALIRKYTEMGQAALAAYKKAVDQHSPSKKFYQSGSYDIQGIIQGAESQRVQMEAEYKKIAQSALGSMEQNMPRSFLAPEKALQNAQASAIAAAMERLNIPSTGQSVQGPAFSAADLAAALRDALSGMSVNMNQRKVGELVTGWQKNNDRGRGV